MGKYKTYEKYKDSGVEWLGEIPEHWEVMPLKRHLLPKIGAIKTGPFGSQLLSSEMNDTEVKIYNQRNVLDKNFVAGNNYISQEKYKELKSFEIFPGDFLITTRGTIGKCAIAPLDCEKGILHPCVMRLQLNPESLIDDFLMYLIQDGEVILEQLKMKSNATTIEVIYSDNLKSVYIPTPPLPEQQTIANFLDYKTKQIDALIAKKETLLEKLDEKRTAIISHAVTKGLDPNVPMKDSGIEWLGEIPEHWEVKNLRYACEFLNKRRIPLSSEERGAMSSKDYPYYGASGIIDYVENFIFDEPTILIAEDGANLLSRSTPLAFIAEGKYWVNNHAHILKPFFGEFKYWANLLCIIKYDYWITGSAQPKLTKDNLASIKLPFPPIIEQEEICNYLEEKTTKIDQQKAKIQQAINLLKEYRTALITNAVTGKIDVRQVTIP